MEVNALQYFKYGLGRGSERILLLPYRLSDSNTLSFAAAEELLYQPPRSLRRQLSAFRWRLELRYLGKCGNARADLSAPSLYIPKEFRER